MRRDLEIHWSGNPTTSTGSPNSAPCDLELVVAEAEVVGAGEQDRGMVADRDRDSSTRPCAGRSRPSAARWWFGAIPMNARVASRGFRRAKETLRRPSAPLATMTPAVKYGPVRALKKVGMGRRWRLGWGTVGFLAGAGGDDDWRRAAARRVGQHTVELVGRGTERGRGPLAAVRTLPTTASP